MAQALQRPVWHDWPDTSTPVTSTILGAWDEGIVNAHAMLPADYVVYSSAGVYYGRSPLGTDYSGADPGAVIQSCITALGAGGGTIMLRGSIAYTSTIPGLPRSLTGRLRICGTGSTKITLASGALRAFDWAKIADYDVFQHIDIGGFTVDCNSLGGAHHVVLGPWQNGSWQRTINLDDVHVHDIRIINAPVGTDSSVDFRIGVHIGMAASTASDTLCTATNCSVKRIWSDGCLQLVAIHGVPVGAETTAKVFHDKILVEDITHDLPTTPTAFNAGANVMAGTKGTGGTITLRRIRGKNSPDVGLEWDGWQNAILDDIVIEDAYDFDYYHVNYNIPADADAQISTLTDCIARRRNLNDHGQGFKVDVVNSNRPGSIHFGAGCLYHRMSTSAGLTVQQEAYDILGSRRVTGELNATIALPTYSGGSDVNPNALRIRSVDTSSRTDARFKAIVRVTGNRTGTGLINWRSLLLREGLLTNFDVDLESDVEITGAGNSVVIHADIGATSGSAILSGRIKVTIPADSGGGGNLPIGIQFESGVFNAVPTDEEIIVHDSNFAGLAVVSTNVTFTGATTLQPNVRYSGNTWRVAKPSAAMGASNFAAATFTTATGNQYIGGEAADIHFATGTGAAITLIEASKDGVIYEQVYAQASGAMAQNVLVPADHGDYIRVTFATTQPTTRVRFRK